MGGWVGWPKDRKTDKSWGVEGEEEREIERICKGINWPIGRSRERERWATGNIPETELTYQRATGHVEEAQLLPALSPIVKLLWRDILLNSQMQWCRLQEHIVKKKKSQRLKIAVESKHTCKYCPRVRMSTPIVLRSNMACSISSSDSPRPSIMDDLVTIPSLHCFACLRTDKLCSYLIMVDVFK